MKRFLYALAAALLQATCVVAQNTTWQAFNDHRPGPGTHPNATGYDLLGVPITGGPLKNSQTGEFLPVGLVVTATGTPLGLGVCADPDAGTPAYVLFNNKVDVGGA